MVEANQAVHGVVGADEAGHLLLGAAGADEGAAGGPRGWGVARLLLSPD